MLAKGAWQNCAHRREGLGPAVSAAVGAVVIDQFSIEADVDRVGVHTVDVLWPWVANRTCAGR